MGNAAAVGIKAGVASPETIRKEFPGAGQAVNPRAPEPGHPEVKRNSAGPSSEITSVTNRFTDADIQTVGVNT